MRIISASNVCKDYYQYNVFTKGKLLTKALKGLSFDVEEGDFFGLLGKNGAGKSTLMKILTTNLTMTAGSASICGYDIENEVRKVKENISWMFGVDYVGVSWSSIERNMELAGAFLGMEKAEARKKAEMLLKMFDLWEQRKLDVWRMSYGMQGKYALAVAMLKRPKILFLDEPLRGLDVESKEELATYLRKINSEGVTIFYTSHELGEVEKLCKNLMIVDEGEIKYLGSMRSLKEKYRELNTLYIECTAKNINGILLDLKKSTRYVHDYEVLESDQDTHKIKVYCPYDTSHTLVTFARLLQHKGVQIQKINAGTLHLEDVFKKILQKDRQKEKIKEIENFTKTKEAPRIISDYLRLDQSPEVKAAACAAFWESRQEEVRNILKGMLSGTDIEQQAAIHAIGKVKTPVFNQELTALASSPYREVRKAAAVALAKNGDKSYTALLLRLLLDYDTSREILEHMQEMHHDALRQLEKAIHKFGRQDRAFLHHQINQLPEKEKAIILKLLRMKHKTYEDWERDNLARR